MTGFHRFSRMICVLRILSAYFQCTSVFACAPLESLAPPRQWDSPWSTPHHYSIEPADLLVFFSIFSFHFISTPSITEAAGLRWLTPLQPAKNSQILRKFREFSVPRRVSRCTDKKELFEISSGLLKSTQISSPTTSTCRDFRWSRTMRSSAAFDRWRSCF